MSDEPMSKPNRIEILSTFKLVYADALIDLDLPDDEVEVAQKIAHPKRKLQWKGTRMPLDQAAELYALMKWGYNNFEPDMLDKLWQAYPDGGIEVTPARESSPAVYLHVPIGQRRQVRVFVEKHFHAGEVDWEQADTLRVWWD